jgi:hypothetical protein
VKRFDQSKKLLLNEKNCCAGVVQNVSEFRRGEPDVQWQENRAGFQNSVVGFEQAVTIGAKECHAVAGLYPRLPQRSRQTSRALGKFGIGKSLLIANHRGSAGVLLLRVAKEAQRGKGNVHGMPRLGQAD